LTLGEEEELCELQADGIFKMDLLTYP
jgi:hypothetical protein